MAEIVIAPNEVYAVESYGWTKVFLAGGITNCPDWQSVVCKYLMPFDGTIIYNPRRVDWTPDISTEEQIVWEYRHLESADVLAFWFSKGSINPITLYELGRWGNSTNVPLIIGMDNEYERVEDVIIQTKLSRRDVHWATDLSQFSQMILIESEKVSKLKNLK